MLGSHASFTTYTTTLKSRSNATRAHKSPNMAHKWSDLGPPTSGQVHWGETGPRKRSPLVPRPAEAKKRPQTGRQFFYPPGPGPEIDFQETDTQTNRQRERQTGTETDRQASKQCQAKGAKFCKIEKDYTNIFFMRLSVAKD